MKPIKPIDLFRVAVKDILRSMRAAMGITQRDIAIKLNPKYDPNNAASDFNNFLHERKDYSIKKQLKLVELLGYDYLEIIRIGEKIIKQKKPDRQFTIENGATYSLNLLLKMIKDIFSSNSNEMKSAQICLIHNIVQYWQFLKKNKNEII